MLYKNITIQLTAAGKKFFGTKKKQLVIEVRENVELNDGYWSGGSRSEYHTLTKSGIVGCLQYPTTPVEFGGGKAPTIPLTDGVAIVKGGCFCGKTAMLFVIVNNEEGWIKPEWGEVVRKSEWEYPLKNSV